MTDNDKNARYRRYRVPAEPDPTRPGRPWVALVGLGVAVLVVIGAGLVFRGVSGPVDVATPTGTMSVDGGSLKGQLEEKRALYSKREAAEWERLLLAGEPLGSDVRITFEGRTFDYDGDTGAGGFVESDE